MHACCQPASQPASQLFGFHFPLLLLFSFSYVVSHVPYRYVPLGTNLVGLKNHKKKEQKQPRQYHSDFHSLGIIISPSLYGLYILQIPCMPHVYRMYYTTMSSFVGEVWSNLYVLRRLTTRSILPPWNTYLCLNIKHSLQYYSISSGSSSTGLFLSL